MKHTLGKRMLCGLLVCFLLLGYIPAGALAAESDGLCEHHTQHTEECGYSENTPCTFQCADCEKEGADKAAAEAVQTLIDALPTADEVQAMPMEAQLEAYNQVQSAYTAYDALADDQKALIPDAEGIFTPLFDYFNSLTAPAAEVIASGACGKEGDNLTYTLTDDGVLTISGTGDMASYNPSSYAPWYAKRGKITQAVLADGVASIGSYAFYGCSKLSAVFIPDSVTTIGDEAFSDCSALTTVSIPSGVASIENSTFSGCSKLTSVSIPDSVTTIGAGAFGGCSELTAVSIPSGVASIENSTFNGCSKLSTVVIPDSVTTIGGWAFSGCSALTAVSLPEKVTSIGSFAFSGCSALTAFSIPSGVTSIESSTFYGCSSLASVTIPEGVSTIAYQAFCRCSALTSVVIPSSVTRMESQAFWDCKKLASVRFKGNGIRGQSMVSKTVIAVYPYGNTTWSQSVRDSYGTRVIWADDKSNVAMTGPCGAEGKNLIYTLTGDGVLTISGTGAMKDYGNPNYGSNPAPWDSFKSVILRLAVSPGVTSIGSYAFYESGLTSVAFGSASLSLGDYSFASCASLQAIDFGTGTITPGTCVFGDCDTLSAVRIPKNVVMNGKYSGSGSGYQLFYSCDELKSATVDCGYVGPFVFEGCYKMTQAAFTDPGVQFYFLEEDSGHPFHANRSKMNVTVYGPLCSKANLLVQKSQGRYNVNLEFARIDGDTTRHTEQILGGTAATCTSPGLSDGKACSVCGIILTKQEQVKALDHDYTGEGCVVVTNPTCTEDGYTTYTCCRKGCGETHTADVIKALDHDYTGEGCVVVTNPTCTEDGYTTYSCCRKGCGETHRADVVKALDHDYTGEGCVVVTNPTCTEDGYTTYTCCREGCGETHRADVVKALNHDYTGEGCVVVTNPTCTEDGYTTYTCCRKGCGETHRADVVKALRHDYTGEGCVVVTNPTCTEDGYTTYTCCRKGCSETHKADEVEASGHNEVTDPAVAATCTAEGKTEGSHCSVCGEVLVAQTVVKSTGHTEVTDPAVPATCTTDGKTEGKHCAVCKTVLVRQEVVKAPGHSYKASVTAPTCGKKGYTTHTCSVCGDSYQDTYVAATGKHTYSDDEDTTCNVCGFVREVGHKRIETVPMYRLYNPNSGEHFYTGSTVERDNLVDAGWRYEGVAWNAPVKVGDPVYRVFNPNSGDHHYTMSWEEVENLKAVGWRYEGVAWNSAPLECEDKIPQYRLYNPNADIGSHHYTSSTEERDTLVSYGWNLEGIGWYGLIK